MCLSALFYAISNSEYHFHSISNLWNSPELINPDCLIYFYFTVFLKIKNMDITNKMQIKP